MNAMVLFPYNFEQQRGLKAFYGQFHLAIRTEDACQHGSALSTSALRGNHCAGVPTQHHELGPCLVTKAINKDPAMFEPEVSWALLGAIGDAAHVGSMVPHREAVYESMCSFLLKRRPYVDRSTYRCYDHLVMPSERTQISDGVLDDE